MPGESLGLTRLDVELALDLAQHPAELDPASAQLRESPGECLTNLRPPRLKAISMRTTGCDPTQRMQAETTWSSHLLPHGSVRRRPTCPAGGTTTRESMAAAAIGIAGGAAGLATAIRRPSSRARAGASSGRRRGNRPSLSAGTRRCRSA